jgi:hypothetical protein
MAATYITMAELRTLLGIGTLYTDAVVEEVAQAAEDYLNKFLWFNTVPLMATEVKETNVATVTTPIPHGFAEDQSVTISGAGATFNGAKTIIDVTTYTFTYAVTSAVTEYVLVRPYGTITGPYNATAYASVPAVREAAATVAVTIWQSRQAPSNAVATVDGFISSPYQLGNTLLAKVRGILAPYLTPSGMAG